MIVLWDNFLDGGTGTGTSLIDRDPDTNIVMDYYKQGYTNTIMLDPTYGSTYGSEVLLPKIFSASDTVLMGYRGFNISKSFMVIADEGEELTGSTLLVSLTWDNDSEQQLSNAWQFGQDFEDDFTWNTIELKTSASDVILMSYYGYS